MVKPVKKICIILISTLIFFCTAAGAFAGDSSFLVRDLDRGKDLVREGDCSLEMSPCSTFKIALCLMGFDAGILKDSRTPLWPYDESYGADREELKQPHNPQMWIRNSCVWYSRVLAGNLGMDRFKHYIDLFEYGNRDIAGDPGKHNGLTGCWLCSSLRITPEGQVSFLSRFLRRDLKVSRRSYELTRDLLFIDKLAGGWSLYGKTGTGFQANKDGELDYKRQFGWFVGWAEGNGRTLVFARLILDQREEQGYAGKRAMSQVRDWLENKGIGL